MRLCIISGDPDFCPYLDETESSELIRSHILDTVPEADLYIWDYIARTDIVARISNHSTAQHLILADAASTEKLGPLPHSACVLLKPASAFTVRAFVELARKACEMRQCAREAEALRLDRDALLQYVIEVNLKLQEYDQERSNFLARAMHDLRAPLTALHGYCGLLADGKLGPLSTSQCELLDRMRFSTSRLTRLASGTMQLLTEGRTTRAPRRLPGDMDEVVEHALHDVYPLIMDKQIEIDVSMQPVGDQLLFEAEQIQQVLINLLENSIKFTPRQGRITIRGYPVSGAVQREGRRDEPRAEAGRKYCGDGYRIDIADSGPGVPERLAEKIFEPYVSYSGTVDRSGGGLGLAICRAIITAHGGSIWATPKRDSGCFSFVLPGPVQPISSDAPTCSEMQLAL